MENLVSLVATEVAARLVVDYGASAVKAGFNFVKNAVFGRNGNVRNAIAPMRARPHHVPA